ncbi:Uncharacterized protein TCM_024367 [Theobroma cacao]|uniref:Uncharacterized protein n=1 Tax=Theobroma cacao TaxID=3641 RepID=A0A061EW45_THECC|nr:Uncharacterized protein TCM_024367 [Theobroma cacao]
MSMQIKLKKYLLSSCSNLGYVWLISHGECNLVGQPMRKMASGYENAIIFLEVDMCTSHPYHNKPLYAESCEYKPKEFMSFYDCYFFRQQELKLWDKLW